MTSPFSWAQFVQGIILLLAAICLCLFTAERRRTSQPEAPSVSTIFSNPFLRIFGTLLMVFIVLDSRGHVSPTQESAAEKLIPSLAGVVLFIIGATVAGADFVLLLVALFKGDETFVKEYFALERRRLEVEAVEPVRTSPAEIAAEAATPRAALQGPSAAKEREEPAAGVSDEQLKPLREQPAMAQLRLPQVWDKIATTQPVRVALVSAGFDPALREHDLFVDRLEPIYTVRGASEGSRGDIGAAALGFIAAIAPSARILLVSIFDESYTTDERRVMHGVQAAIEWSPDVLLLEFGGPNPIPRLRRAIKECSDSILFVAPAGNDGDDRPTYPASDDAVVAVAATTSRGELAAFSSCGRGVRLAAPGVDVLTLVGAEKGALVFKRMSGTSMAAGLAAGVVSLAFAAHPDMTPAKLTRNLLKAGKAVQGHRDIRLLDAEKLITFDGRK
jgi:subtilisin family serine protease